MHYKTKGERHENIIKLRLNDEQLERLEAYARFHDLPIAVAARQFFKLGSDVLFQSDDSLNIEKRAN